MRVILLAAALVLAGCAEEPGGTLTASVSSSAPDAVPEADFGSISGLVVNDEQAPIPDANVGLVGIGNVTTTDSGGRFTFNGLEPGAYTLSVQKIGFGPFAKKVDVIAQEVTEITVILAPFAIIEKYLDVRPIVSYIKFGESFVDIVTHEGGNANTFCESCHVYFTIAPKPADARLEVHWRASVALPPALNDDIFYLLCKDFQNGTAASYRCGGAGSSGTSAGSGYLKNRGSAPLTLLGNSTNFRYDIHAGQSIAYELRVNSWLSFAYGEEFVPEYTALPPP